MALRWGWQMPFVVMGVAGLAWLVLWLPLYDDPNKIAEVTKGLGAPRRGIALEEIPDQERLAVRGW